MYRKPLPLISVSLVLLCFVCNGTSVHAQIYGGYGGSGCINCSINRCFDDPCCSSCCKDGVRNWYYRNFGSDYPCGGLGCFNLHSCSSCRHRGLCGHRAGFGACGPSFGAVNRAACCHPVPNCCGAMSSGAMVAPSATGGSVSGTPTPVPDGDAATAPIPASAKPDSSEAPKPVN